MVAAATGPALMCADVAGLLLLLASLRPPDVGWWTCATGLRCRRLKDDD